TGTATMAAPPTERSFDVIVVGAGIMGSCAAHAAAAWGASVLLLERFDLLHQRGSSHGESRTTRPIYTRPQYPPMVRLAHRLWDDAQRDAGYAVLTPTPHFNLGPRDDPAFLAAVANGSAIELAPSSADAPAWAEAFRVPQGWAVARSELGLGLGGVIKATKAVAMFQALAAKMGAVVRDRAEVVDVARKQVSTRRRRYDRGEDIKRRGVPRRQVHHHGGRVGDQVVEVRHRHRPAGAVGAHPRLLLEGQARARARADCRGRIPDVRELRRPRLLRHAVDGVPWPDQDLQERRAAVRPRRQGLGHRHRRGGDGGARGAVDRRGDAGSRGHHRRAGALPAVHVLHDARPGLRA
uniref:FAD dependent oxidoreductase domain-containing protein n=1 Tax=Aegilops tauschii subsp. strangulata TaxID=200361 RepID=A0A453L6A1_AEGTS